VRRRKNVKDTVEKFSIVKTLKAIDDANVVVLVLDAQEGLVDQDLHLLGMAMDAGRALVIAFNKWDGLNKESKDYIRKELDRKLHFMDYAQIHYISALHGSGVGDLYGSIDKAFKSATAQLQTNRLTQILQGAVFDHAPPMVNGRRIKLRLAHSGGHNPPIIVIHGNQTSKVPDHYKRYLEKVFRRELKLEGTPIRIEFKSGENPFENRSKKLQGGRGAVNQSRDSGAGKKGENKGQKASYKKTETAKPAKGKFAKAKPATNVASEKGPGGRNARKQNLVKNKPNKR
jgi:GTP-binding protein